MRPMYKCFGLLLAVSLALFFGLFFGLNYPEIVRHGWPLARCKVLSAEIATRYCCETSCSTGSCQSAPGGSPQCSSVTSSIDISPSACASNSSSCPSQSGSVCDGGYYCCRTCCQTCQSCTSSCSGNPPTCTQSCTSYKCNCYCCSSTSVSYVQDFSKDVNNADSFLNRHLANSTSFCNYNPKDESCSMSRSPRGNGLSRPSLESFPYSWPSAYSRISSSSSLAGPWCARDTMIRYMPRDRGLGV
ncbi:hypothetical protein B0H14DRAFT_2842482 [Mycena olivaceomarginata]|nr:hypothetical protein B0H14DRAFT_2842482 [Mycena olivaceomarginata]